MKVANANGFDKAGGTYAVKEQLKACGYRYQNAGQPCWTKPWLTKGFELAAIQCEVWMREADGVIVSIYGEDGQQSFGEVLVNKGGWKEIRNELAEITTIDASSP